MINNLYFNGKLSTETKNEITPKYLLEGEINSNAPNNYKSLKKQKQKTANKGTMIDKSITRNYKENINDTILNVFHKILYVDVNKINKRNKLNEKNIGDEVDNDYDMDKQNEKVINRNAYLWHRLINRNYNKLTKSDSIFILKKTTRKVKTPKNIMKSKKFNYFSIKKKKKRINSSKFYFELETLEENNKEYRETENKEPKLKKVKVVKKEKTYKNLANVKNIKKNRTKYYNIIQHKSKEKRKNIFENRLNNTVRSFKKDYIKNIKIGKPLPKLNIKKFRAKTKIKKKKVDINDNSSENNEISENSEITENNEISENNEENYINNKISNSFINSNNNNNNIIFPKKENNHFLKNEDIKNIFNSGANNNNSNNNININLNNNIEEKNEKTNRDKKLSIDMDFKEKDKERKYYAIIKKIVTTINFDLVESEFSLTKNLDKSKNINDNNNNNDNLNKNITDDISNADNSKNTNVNKNKKIKIEKEKEMNLFDKFIIEYRKKLYYERELRKANQKMSKLIDEENKKVNKYRKRYLKARKQKYISLFHQDKLNITNLDDNKIEDIKDGDKKKKRVGQTHFVGINLNSMQDIEKKKMEILYRIKHDIKYKISRGDINLSEMDNFNKFQDKINDLKKVYENFSINLYVKELEEFFSSFEDELSSKEKNKYDEDRINDYLRRLKEDFNEKNFMRKLYEQKLCKVIDFNKINNINTLNEGKNNEDMK